MLVCPDIRRQDLVLAAIDLDGHIGLSPYRPETARMHRRGRRFVS